MNINDKTTINRKLKDSLFTHLFRDVKYQRQLYAALGGDADSCDDTDFKLLTLENTLVYDVYNDLGLLVKDRLILLVEAQSSYNPNMALRMLVYIANTYYEYVIDNRLNIYGAKRVELPTPEFVLIYTGKKKLESKLLKLSDSYVHGADVPLELVTKVITEEDQGAGIIEEYIQFCRKYDNLKYGSTTKEEVLQALKKTIKYCKAHNILKEFLVDKEKEVENIMMGIFTQEHATDMILNEKYQQGIEQGIEQVAKKLKSNGTDIEVIMKSTGLTKEEVLKL